MDQAMDGERKDERVGPDNETVPWRRVPSNDEGVDSSEKGFNLQDGL